MSEIHAAPKFLAGVLFLFLLELPVAAQTCVSSCGGSWRIDGSGPPPALAIHVMTTVPFANPSEHLAAVVVGPGTASTLKTLPSGCTFDVQPPVSVFLLGPAIEQSIPFDASGLPPHATFTFEVVIRDNGDSGCGDPPAQVLISNPLELHMP